MCATALLNARGGVAKSEQLCTLAPTGLSLVWGVPTWYTGFEVCHF